MSKKIRNDGVLSPDELLKAIEEYKKRRQTEADAEDEEVAEEVEVSEKKPAEEIPEEATIEEKIEAVKGRRDRRDEEGDPEDEEEALGVIANQDEDISVLFDIIDTLLAEREFKGAEKADCGGKRRDADEEEFDPAVEEEFVEEDVEKADCGPKRRRDAEEAEEDFEVEEFEEDEDEEEFTEEEDFEEDEDEEEEFIDEKEIKMNTDSIDRIVRTRIELGTIGRKLNMDGLENMKIRQAKKAIIKAVRPAMNLDGKSAAYIDAAYSMAVEEAKRRGKKDTRYQKKQMFSKTTRSDSKGGSDSADAAYKRMIERQTNRV